jgi:hypothetical protein
MYNFIESCLRGDSLLEDIDDYIDTWHEGDSEEPLYAFLGMTQEEYAAWVEAPDVLAFIVTAHKYRTTLKEAIAQAAVMAARSDTVARASQIETWLKEEQIGV